MLRKKKAIDYGVVNSVIGEDAEIKGEVKTKGSIRFSGLFEGRVEAAGDVLVSEGSKIVGDISATRIVVSGNVQGNILAGDGLEITKTGKVFGDVTGNRLIVDEGAIYKGKVNLHMPESEEEKSARPVVPASILEKKPKTMDSPLYEELKRGDV